MAIKHLPLTPEGEIDIVKIATKAGNNLGKLHDKIVRNIIRNKIKGK